MLELLGVTGGLLFACAGLPSALATLRAGKSIGTPISIAWLIVSGCALLFTYLTIRNGLDWVIVLNYGLEVACWMVVLKFHYLPRNA